MQTHKHKIADLEMNIRWLSRHEFARKGYRGYCFPIIHPDHAIGAMGRYQILAVWQPRMDLPPGVRSFYYQSLEKLIVQLRSGSFMEIPGHWIPMPTSPEIKRWPELLQPKLILPEKAGPQMDIEEADDLHEVIHKTGVEGEVKPAAVVVEGD